MQELTIALAGNPNSGKTTLFNALTGANQRVGNWPGVTVERKSGQCLHLGQQITVVDLPGTYSLQACDNAHGLDEHIASEYLLSNAADLIVNVVDGANLERNLYLTTQLLEMNKPMLVVVTMLDVAKGRRLSLDLTALSHQLGVPVVAMEGRQSLSLIRDHCLTLMQSASTAKRCPYPSEVNRAQVELQGALLEQSSIAPSMALTIATRLLEGCCDKAVSPKVVQALMPTLSRLKQGSTEPLDILIADSRYDYAHHISKAVLRKHAQAPSRLTERLDSVVLHRFLGIPFFFAVMYLMFLFAINIGGALQDSFDLASQAFFMDLPAVYLTQWGVPGWLVGIIAGGVGKGLNTTLTFAPVIFALFFFLSLLEASGYMARGAFVMDRVMRFLGLPGKAFVPLIVGLGCNVPAIMSTRTLGSERDRILTIMMSPFIACSARLAIFAVFVSAFFQSGGQNVVFSLYLIGVLVAVFTGFILRHSVLQGAQAPLILELPPYHLPKLSAMLRQAWSRLKHFLSKAGKVIVPLCVLLGGLNAMTLDGGFQLTGADSNSLLALMAKWITPLFAPMGISADNWPATVGLLTGAMAKEVVVATLNALYVPAVSVTKLSDFALLPALKAALLTVPSNLYSLGEALFNPVLASAPQDELSRSAYGAMAARFGSVSAAYAYLLFIVLYVPCVSTMAVIKKELNARWMWFSIAWSISLAYTVAVTFYQCATFHAHPLQTASVLLVVISLVFFAWLLLRRGRFGPTIKRLETLGGET